MEACRAELRALTTRPFVPPEEKEAPVDEPEEEAGQPDVEASDELETHNPSEERKARSFVPVEVQEKDDPEETDASQEAQRETAQVSEATARSFAPAEEKEAPAEEAEENVPADEPEEEVGEASKMAEEPDVDASDELTVHNLSNELKAHDEGAFAEEMGEAVKEAAPAEDFEARSVVSAEEKEAPAEEREAPAEEDEENIPVEEKEPVVDELEAHNLSEELKARSLGPAEEKEENIPAEERGAGVKASDELLEQPEAAAEETPAEVQLEVQEVGSTEEPPLAASCGAPPGHPHRFPGHRANPPVAQTDAPLLTSSSLLLSCGRAHVPKANRKRGIAVVLVLL